MEYTKPPHFPMPVEKQPIKTINKGKIKPKEGRQIVIKKAQVRDAEEILDLVNGYAASNLMLARGPQYLYENIRDFVIAVDRNVPVYTIMEPREVLHLIVACGSAHVLWEDIAELRAIAIHSDYKQLGLGSKLVEFMKADAKQLGIRRLYTFTLTEAFFKTLGFSQQKRGELPAKVWGECSRCPKYFKCDEIGMMLKL